MSRVFCDRVTGKHGEVYWIIYEHAKFTTPNLMLTEPEMILLLNQIELLREEAKTKAVQAK